MRVLHLPIIICNQPWEMSRGLRKIGVKSDYMIQDDNNASWLLPGSPDINLNIYHRSIRESAKKIRRDVKIFLYKSLFKYDIYHYHSNYSLLDYEDLKILKRFKKKIVVSYWGCDIRLPSINSKAKYNSCSDCKIDCDESLKTEKLATFSQYADLLLIHSPEQKDYCPKGKFIPQSIDTDFWQSMDTRETNSKVFRVYHSVGNSAKRGNVKGSKEILDAIHRLKEEGYRIELIRQDGLTNRELKPFYEKADLVIESLRDGYYGITAIEAMSLAKPVMVYIRPNFVKSYTGLPIINANPGNIYQKLKWAINHRENLKKIGKKSRQYAVKTHDSAKVAKKIYRLYKSLYQND